MVVEACSVCLVYGPDGAHVNVAAFAHIDAVLQLQCPIHVVSCLLVVPQQRGVYLRIHADEERLQTLLVGTSFVIVLQGLAAESDHLPTVRCLYGLF